MVSWRRPSDVGLARAKGKARVKRCLKCRILADTAARFCGHCGSDLPLSDVEEAEFEEDEEKLPTGTIVLYWFLDTFPGLLRPVVIIMSVLALALAGAGLWLTLFLFTMGAMISAFGIGAGAVIIYWTAWSWLLYGRVCVPAEAMAEFDGRKWFVFVLATVVPIGTLFGLVK